ncbi:MAG: DUF2061 domain-containing protein [Bacteroidota bacterium]
MNRRKMKDTNVRSLVKGISWRAVGTVDTFLLALLFFGDLRLAAPIAATEVFSKILLFYFHERLWNVISWGRLDGKPSHLRSIVKGVSWRFMGSVDTIIISWIYSGNPLGAFKIGASEVITKIALFYLHERVWALVRWGRVYVELPADISAG